MQSTTRTIITLLTILIIPGQVRAGWEAAAKIGYDSNVNRSTVQEESDTYLDLVGAYVRDADPGRRLDWTLRAAGEGTAYARIDDLDALGFFLSPGATISPAAWWSVSLEPFFQAKTVRDTDQSAWAFGGSVRLDQQWTPFWYSGASYTYTDSHARVDTYSFIEHAVGAFLGKSWENALFCEIGYEYAQGTSFQTFPSVTATSISNGRGYRHGYSSTFEAEVVRDDVTRHSAVLTLGYTTGSFTPHLGYRYSRSTGDVGTTYTHEALAGIRYTFTP